MDDYKLSYYAEEVDELLTKAENAVLYTPQELTEEQKAQARENIGAAAIPVLTDEELLASGVEFRSAEEAGYNLIGNNVWTSTSTNTPAYAGETSGMFCTRKFKTSRVPTVSFAGTAVLSYVFWMNGVNVREIRKNDMPASLVVDFEFDEIAINFSYGWDNFKNANPKAYVLIFFPDVCHFGKVLVLGDSISADYYGNYTKWVTHLINQKVFPADTNNSSTHATGFVARYNNEANDFITRIEAIENKSIYDLVIVFGGINDFIQAIPMGERGGDKIAQFIPAVDYFFEYLVDNFTQARIVVLSPLRVFSEYANSAGHMQAEYSDYLKETAKKYCLPVLNLTDESGFCPNIEAFKNMWTLIPDGYESTDGVHPNAEYQQKFLAPMIKGFLLSIKPDK